MRRLLNADADSRYRLQTTTESWDLPVPNVALPQNLQREWAADSMYGTKKPSHFVDLLKAKFLEMRNGTGAEYALPPNLA